MEPSTPSRHSRPHSSHSSWTTDSWVSSFADLGSTSPPPDSSPTSYCTTPTRAVRSSKALTVSSPISLTPQKHQGRHEVPPTSQHLSPYASRNGSLISRAPTKAPGAHISFSIPLDAQLPPSRTPSRRLVRTGSYTAGLSASTLPMRMPSNESTCKFPSEFEDSSSEENDERAMSRLATSSTLLASSTQASLPPPSTPLPQQAKSKQHVSRHDAASSAALALQQMAHTASLPYFGRHGSNTSRSSTATSTAGYVSSTTLLPSNERSTSNSIFRRQASAHRTSSGATSSRDAARSSSGATVFHSTRRPPPTQTSFITKRPPSPSHDLTGYDDGPLSKRPRPQQTQARPAHRALKPLFGRGAPSVPGPSSRTRGQMAAAPHRAQDSATPFNVPVVRRKLTVKPFTLPQASEVASSARREPAPTQASPSNEPHSSREERARRRRDGIPASFPATSQPSRPVTAAQSLRTSALDAATAPPRAPATRIRASTAVASTSASSSSATITPSFATQSITADPRRVTQFPGFYRKYRVPCHLPSNFTQQVYTTSITAAALSTNSSSNTNTTQAAYTCSLTTLRIPRRFATSASAPIVSNADYDDPFNLYTPRFVRGRGQDKLGLCPLCFEEDDGQGDQTWHRTKVSAYNYHIQMHHGISFMTGKPFDPPTRYRDVEMEVTISGSTVQKVMPQGLCHACGKWIDLDSVKPVAVKIPEVYFRKHAVQCHKGREKKHSDPHDYLIKDDFYHRVAQAVRDSS